MRPAGRDPAGFCFADPAVGIGSSRLPSKKKARRKKKCTLAFPLLRGRAGGLRPPFAASPLGRDLAGIHVGPTLPVAWHQPRTLDPAGLAGRRPGRTALGPEAVTARAESLGPRPSPDGNDPSPGGLTPQLARIAAQLAGRAASCGVAGQDTVRRAAAIHSLGNTAGPGSGAGSCAAACARRDGSSRGSAVRFLRPNSDHRTMGYFHVAGRGESLAKPPPAKQCRGYVKNGVPRYRRFTEVQTAGDRPWRRSTLDLAGRRPGLFCCG